MIEYDNAGINYRFFITLEYLKFKKAFATQAELVRLLNISASQFSEMRRGRFGLPLKTLWLLKENFPKLVSYKFILQNEPSQKLKQFMVKVGYVVGKQKKIKPIYS